MRGHHDGQGLAQRAAGGVPKVWMQDDIERVGGAA